MGHGGGGLCRWQGMSAGMQPIRRKAKTGCMAEPMNGRAAMFSRATGSRRARHRAGRSSPPMSSGSWRAARRRGPGGSHRGRPRSSTPPARGPPAPGTPRRAGGDAAAARHRARAATGRTAPSGLAQHLDGHAFDESLPFTRVAVDRQVRRVRVGDTFHQAPPDAPRLIRRAGGGSLQLLGVGDVHDVATVRSAPRIQIPGGVVGGAGERTVGELPLQGNAAFRCRLHPDAGPDVPGATTPNRSVLPWPDLSK